MFCIGSAGGGFGFGSSCGDDGDCDGVVVIAGGVMIKLIK